MRKEDSWGEESFDAVYSAFNLADAAKEHALGVIQAGILQREDQLLGFVEGKQIEGVELNETGLHINMEWDEFKGLSANHYPSVHINAFLYPSQSVTAVISREETVNICGRDLNGSLNGRFIAMDTDGMNFVFDSSNSVPHDSLFTGDGPLFRGMVAYEFLGMVSKVVEQRASTTTTSQS